MRAPGTYKDNIVVAPERMRQIADKCINRIQAPLRPSVDGNDRQPAEAFPIRQQLH
jgi:hypothetical protein